MSDFQLDEIVGARLDRIVLFAASISLHFEKEERLFQLSTSCDVLVPGDSIGGNYPLSANAFAKLTGAIDGEVENLLLTERGDYELTVAGSSIVIRDEQAMDGVFGLVVKDANGVVLEASFEGGSAGRSAR